MTRLLSLGTLLLVALAFPEWTSAQGNEETVDHDSWKYSGRTKEEYELVVSLLQQYRMELRRKYNMTESDTEEDAATYDPSAVGDILITPAQARALLQSARTEASSLHPTSSLDFLITPTSKWGLKIYYHIDTNSNYTEGMISTIHSAFTAWQKKTCLTFSHVKRWDIIHQPDVVLVVRQLPGYRSTCNSYVGRYSVNGDNTQIINLGSNCIAEFGYALHEIGHALGLLHEHQRPDRDDYVTINEENVYSRQALDTNFYKFVQNVEDFGLPYDYGSVMHYTTRSFAKDTGLETIVPPHNWLKSSMGQRSEITFYDAAAINHAYCTEKCTNVIECENGGYQDYSNCSRCICPDIFAGTHCERTTTEGSPNCTPLSGRLPVLQDSSTVCVSTPGYEKFKFGSYQPGDACTWFIQIPSGCRAHIWFNKQHEWGQPNILGYRTCHDWFEFRHLGLKQRHGERVCGYVKPLKYFLSTPLVVNNTITPVLFRAHFFNYQVRYDTYGAELCYKLEDVSCLPPGHADACASDPCQNGGHCSFSANHYTCTCPAGFTGQNCESSASGSLVTSRCASNPCQRDSTCTDMANGYVCVCEAGYTGARCELAIDECASNPCQRDSTCTDLANGYVCVCEAGYTGARCELNIDECASNPCQRDSMCTDLVNGYVCVCEAGYTGARCELNIDECASSPCENSGTCVDLTGEYECSCMLGFVGYNCESQLPPHLDAAINITVYNPKVGGTLILVCVPEKFMGGDTYQWWHNGRIVSARHYYYKQLETEADAGIYTCRVGRCMHYAEASTRIGVRSSKADKGLSDISNDVNSDVISSLVARALSDISSDPKSDVISSLVARALSDISSSQEARALSHVDADIDECASSPCENSGTCVDLLGEYECSCMPGFNGYNCESQLPPHLDVAINITVYNPDTSLEVGGTLVLVCVPEKFIGGDTYQWWHNGRIVSARRYYYKQLVTEADAGIYTCRVMRCMHYAEASTRIGVRSSKVDKGLSDVSNYVNSDVISSSVARALSDVSSDPKSDVGSSQEARGLSDVSSSQPARALSDISSDVKSDVISSLVAKALSDIRSSQAVRALNDIRKSQAAKALNDIRSSQAARGLSDGLNDGNSDVRSSQEARALSDGIRDVSSDVNSDGSSDVNDIKADVNSLEAAQGLSDGSSAGSNTGSSDVNSDVISDGLEAGSSSSVRASQTDHSPRVSTVAGVLLVAFGVACVVALAAFVRIRTRRRSETSDGDTARSLYVAGRDTPHTPQTPRTPHAMV